MPAEQTTEDRYHYGVIARALKIIDEAGGATLPLDDLATRLSMSPAHFQRVFTRWVGVSPKRYQQYLTLDHARRLLAERHTLLDTAGAAGLSGAGRLHDLFVRWEAMSPGDFAKGAEGLVIRWGWFDSPFGPALSWAPGAASAAWPSPPRRGRRRRRPIFAAAGRRQAMPRIPRRSVPGPMRPSAGRRRAAPTEQCLST